MQDEFMFEGVELERRAVLEALARLHRDDFRDLCKVMRAHLYRATLRSGIYGERARQLGDHLRIASELPPLVTAGSAARSS